MRSRGARSEHEEAARQLAALGGAHGERRGTLGVPPGRPGDEGEVEGDEQEPRDEGAGEQVADRDRRAG